MEGIIAVNIFILAGVLWIFGTSVCKLLDEQNFILKDIADILESLTDKS